MNEKGDKTMIYIGDNLPTHDHPEENKGGDDYETTLESCEKRNVLGSRNEDY